VLRPGGTFVGSDSPAGMRFRLNFVFHTGVPVDPDRFRGRLEAPHFTDVKVAVGPKVFRFRGTRLQLESEPGLLPS
jgi:hypothetical protein